MQILALHPLAKLALLSEFSLIGTLLFLNWQFTSLLIKYLLIKTAMHIHCDAILKCWIGKTLTGKILIISKPRLVVYIISLYYYDIHMTIPIGQTRSVGRLKERKEMINKYLHLILRKFCHLIRKKLQSKKKKETQ